MGNTRRVVITGLGIVTAIGNNLQDFWSNLIEGRCGIKQFDLFEHKDYRTHIAAMVEEIPDPNLPLPPFDSPLSKGGYRWVRKDRFSRSDRLGLSAAGMAIEDSGLTTQDSGLKHPLPNPPLYEPLTPSLRPSRGRKGVGGRLLTPNSELHTMGISLGVGVGGMLDGEEYHKNIYKEKKARPSILISQQPSTTADLIAGCWGLTGTRMTIMTACSSSAVALGYALDIIRLGYQDLMIAGGVESLCRLTYSGFNSLRLVDTDICKPFDMKRNGLSLGEGSAFLILEELNHAMERKANIYAEFMGYGLSCDAGHMTAPLPGGEGAAMAIKNAIEDAGITPDEVDYINAHGTATPLNDAMETKAIKSVFGEKTAIPVSSIKAMVGHTLGAAGAIEAVATVLTIYNGIIPPTINYSVKDPECDLDYVVNKARESDVNIAISNSFAFGGNNACLIFKRWKG